jgi:hypothetical protein
MDALIPFLSLTVVIFAAPFVIRRVAWLMVDIECAIKRWRDRKAG